MAPIPLPLFGQDITYNNNTIDYSANKVNDGLDELDNTDIKFMIYVPIIITFTIYIVITLILYILGKKSKLMIIRDISLYIYSSISIFIIVVILLLDSALDSSQTYKQLPGIINILGFSYMLPIWFYSNIVRIEKIECRLKIQNARLNTSYKYDNDDISNSILHKSLTKFQFYEKWSSYLISIMVVIISVILFIIYIINPAIYDENEENYIKPIGSWIIIGFIIICLLYDIIKYIQLKKFKENIGMHKELVYIIFSSILCVIIYATLELLSVEIPYIPNALWIVIYFMFYHSIIIVKPVFTVQIYKSKVELLQEELQNKTSSKTDTKNEFELSNFEKVLDPKSSIYTEFKNFLVAEVCIENLLFYETIISLLLKYQKESPPQSENNSRRSSFNENETASNNSWNIFKLFNKGRGIDERAFKSYENSLHEENQKSARNSSCQASMVSSSNNSNNSSASLLHKYNNNTNNITVSITNMKNPNANINSNNNMSNNNNTKETQSQNIPYYEKLYNTLYIPEVTPSHISNIKKIYHKFIPEGSEYQLNLTSDLRKSVEQKISSNNDIDIYIFKPVVKEVFELLRWTNYPRFLQIRNERNQN